MTRKHKIDVYTSNLEQDEVDELKVFVGDLLVKSEVNEINRRNITRVYWDKFKKTIVFFLKPTTPNFLRALIEGIAQSHHNTGDFIRTHPFIQKNNLKVKSQINTRGHEKK